MNVLRYQQRSILEELTKHLMPNAELLEWDPVLKKIDLLLDDEELVVAVHEALARRHPRSRIRGRDSTPSEVVLRLVVLKHMRNWSFDEMEREVRANVVYREFTRIGWEKVPDAKTMIRLFGALGKETIRRIHERVVALARERKVARGAKMRVDTTVVETNIHYPTDSRLLGDALRVITRTIKKLKPRLGEGAVKFRNRLRSVGRRLWRIAQAARSRSEGAKAKRKELYGELLAITRKVLRESREVQATVGRAVEAGASKTVEKLGAKLEAMIELAERVMAQTRVRVLDGDVHYEGKLLSVFETETEAIRKGKASCPTEFGKMVKIQEAENQIVTDYLIEPKRSPDTQLLSPSIDRHQEIFGRAPWLVAADAAFYSAANEQHAREAGVQRVAIPNRHTRSQAKRAEQKQRWFRKAQAWRTGCEGRISVLKRRQGLRRSRYRGPEGMERWVGLGVIANNLIAIAESDL